MQLSSVANWIDTVNQELYADRDPKNDLPSPERVSQELIPDLSSSATQGLEGSIDLANPFKAEEGASSAKATDAPPPIPARGYHGNAVRRMTQLAPRMFRLSVIVGVGLASLLVPAVREPVLSWSQSSLCASPLGAAFTFCHRPQDVVVMHDFAALAQLHQLTLATLYDTALGVWTLSEELAHKGRGARQLAYYAEDSTLPVRDSLAHDLVILDENTKTAANSLNKLGATTVGTVMRTGASFERIFRTVHDVQAALDGGGGAPRAGDVAATLAQTFLAAAGELREDLEALQNATFFTLGDLAVLEEQVHALDAVARREERALDASADVLERKAAQRFFWARARAEAALDRLLDNAALVGAIRDRCADARAAVSASARAVAQMLAEMEYLAGLPTTRLRMDGAALPQLVGDLKAYSRGIEEMLGRFETARAQERAKRWAAVDARRGEERMQIEEAD